MIRTVGTSAPLTVEMIWSAAEVITGVDDQCVNALGDEGVDLLVLLGLVVVAVDDGAS